MIGFSTQFPHLPIETWCLIIWTMFLLSLPCVPIFIPSLALFLVFLFINLMVRHQPRLNRRMNQMGGSSLFSTSASSSSSSSSTQISDAAKSEWQKLMAVYKNHRNPIIPRDLGSATKEEMHLQELSAATAYHLDKDGHRCAGAPDSVLQVVELPHPLETLSLHSNSLFVRDFYPRLVQRIFLDSKHKRCVLIGNPGISKSFFHWYFFLIIISFHYFLQYTY